MLTKLAIFDIDGVLANDKHRVEYALDRRWSMYFDKDRMSADGVWSQGREFMQAAQMLDYQIMYMTGRRDDRREITKDWLYDHNFPNGILVMRKFKETMRLAEFKAQKMEAIASTKTWEEYILFDDDPEVIQLVGERVGIEHVHHCTWHIKEKALVRRATA